MDLDGDFLEAGGEIVTPGGKFVVPADEIATRNEKIVVGCDEIVVAGDEITVTGDKITVAPHEIAVRDEKILMSDQKIVAHDGEFEAYRGLLFSIAYRMTGSAADAEDLVQDAYIRYASTDTDVVRDVKAFLVTILTRLALDKLKSAQHQREEYIGPWLPEPVLTGIDGDPYARATRDERIELALLRTLERLAPQERAVFLLHEVLDHDHNEIGELLEITPASSRQILHRAKERVAAEKRRFVPSAEEQRRIVEKFMAALEAGNVDALRDVLAQDVVSIGDGGGKAFAARHPIAGFEAVARLWLGLAAKYTEGLEITLAEANGAPAIVGRRDGNVENILTFTFDGGRIAELVSVVNPEKLQFAARQLRRG